MKALKMAVLLAALLSVPVLAATIASVNHEVGRSVALPSVQVTTLSTHLSMSMISTAMLASSQNQNGQGGNNNNQGGNNQGGNNQGCGTPTVHGAEMSKTAILLAGLLAFTAFLLVRRFAHKRS